MRRTKGVRRTVILLVLIQVLLVFGVLVGEPGVTTGAVQPAAAQTNDATPFVRSDEAKKELYLRMLEDFVPHAEEYWRSSDISEPNTGRYVASGPGVTQSRGSGNLAIAYATLLTANPEKEEFAVVPREVMMDHLIKSIRHTALTNKLSGAGYDRWGGGTWQASLETYSWGLAAHLIWDELDDDTRELVERVVVGEANILIEKPIDSGTPGNTAAEDSGWNTPTPALAAVMFPEDPNRAKWEETATRLALNASSAEQDHDSEQVIDGRPLKDWIDWIESTNLNPDLTMENHGFFNPSISRLHTQTLGTRQ